MNAPFLLTGHDFEGETRELGFDTLARAVEIAGEVSRADPAGPPWRDWEVWGNDPQTEEWRPLVTSDSQAAEPSLSKL
jgi:hypothetical protein